MERTIRRDGFLFRYAYWFKLPHKRPETINRCPFFWRLLFVTLVGMPVWWLVWMPLVFVVGFWFAVRPAFFHGESAFEDYDHWPHIGDVRIWPGAVLLGVLAAAEAFIVLTTIPRFYGHSFFFWIGAGLVTIVGALIVFFALFFGKEELAKTEWYRMARDAWRERKQGICPTYRVQ